MIRKYPIRFCNELFSLQVQARVQAKLQTRVWAKLWSRVWTKFRSRARVQAQNANIANSMYWGKNSKRSTKVSNNYENL